MSDFAEYKKHLARAGKPICDALAMVFGSVSGAFDDVPAPNRKRYLASLAGVKVRLSESSVQAALNPRKHGIAFASGRESEPEREPTGEETFAEIRRNAYGRDASDPKPAHKSLADISAAAWANFNKRRAPGN